MRHVQRSVLPLLILALAAPLRAADRQLIASLLEKAYTGQDMVLRTFNSGSTVRYSADGQLVKGGNPGPWTLDADLQCTGVELKRKELVIKGKRLYFVYDKPLEKLRPYLGPDVEIEIALGNDAPSISTLQQAVTKVFVTRSENPSLLVPDYWKEYVLHPTRSATTPPPEQMTAVPLASMQKLTGESKQPALPLTSIHQVQPAADPGKSQNVTAPKPIYKPEPAYTPEARLAHIEGWVVLFIDIDASGQVVKDSIVRPVGMGLDDNAVQTVQTWKFEPATRDGKPVPVRVLVEVNFRLR